ncbi:hypothetical protein [Komagataeibacter oboediens]|uniref:hypothetical protein n=1 Tax=Komagataeibacter oboediens TaxID=65958 RepID=UPI0012F52A2F|nr:hypothetical protein [Komagataeibacter oboediens]
MTVIVAEIFCGTPILIGDTAVTYPQYSESGIDAPLRDGSSFIHSAQQKIIQINSHFALGGAGDAYTIQEFVNRIIQKSEKICTLEHLKDILSEINFCGARDSEIIGVFYPGGSGEATAFHIDIRPSKSRKSSCLSLGNRFCIGSGARLVEERLANFEHIRDDNSLPSDTIEARILGIINNLMLEDRETGEAQRNRFGLSYTAILHDRDKFKRIPNYISLFGTFILLHRADKHMSLEWKKNPVLFLL